MMMTMNKYMKKGKDKNAKQQENDEQLEKNREENKNKKRMMDK